MKTADGNYVSRFPFPVSHFPFPTSHFSLPHRKEDNLSILQAVVLGLVQGLTEFLPISSSGHLVLIGDLLHVSDQDITFEVMVHFGTFLSIITVFYKDVWRLIQSSLRGIGVLSRPYALKEHVREDPYLQLALWIVIGTIPAVALGLPLKEYIEGAFTHPLLVSIALLVTGGMLWSTRYVEPGTKDVGWRDACIIGLVQSIAMLPGISRSGSTISAGLWKKVDRAKAAEFSFLLALPAILGAAILEGKELTLVSTHLWPLMIGTLVAYISGVVSIRLLLGIIRRGKLNRFAYYCWAVGILGLVFHLR